MLHLTLRQLQVIQSVARHESLSRAAAELHLSQPGVSMQLKKLSDAVGVALIEQIGKRIRLTAAGRELAQASRDVFGALERCETQLAALSGMQSGRLRLMVITTASYFAPRLLGEFSRRYPGIEVSLSVTNRERVLASIAEGQDDIYFLGQPPEGLEVVAQPFMENPLLVVAPLDHPLASARNIPLARLSEEPWLMRESGSGTRKAVEQMFADQGLSLNRRMELGANEAIKQAILAGLGISVLSRHSLVFDAAHQFAFLDVEGFPILRHWYAVYPAKRPLSRVARAFLDFLFE
jgi:DNA-binding transcriptional LysR family regulator